MEEKHLQPHMTDNPDFEPVRGSPTIEVTIRTDPDTKDREEETDRMYREHESETAKAEAKAAAERENGNGVSEEEQVLMGEQTYTLGTRTTYEYDVVACEDFVEDKGCWVRNMPEEIRKANPHFVPS